MFIWIGSEGFMRGPVRFLFFIGSVAVAFAGIMVIFGQIKPPESAWFILFVVLAILYIIAYIIAPKRLKPPLWEKLWKR